MLLQVFYMLIWKANILFPNYIQFPCYSWNDIFILFLGWNNTDLVLAWRRKAIEVIFCFTNYSWTKNSELANICVVCIRAYMTFINCDTHMILSNSVIIIVLWCAQPVFRRFLRPEKEYLSFSLIYNNGERSLDLVSAWFNK